MIEVPCHCGHLIQTDLVYDTDLSMNPDIYKKIIDGSFMSFRCPECGNLIKTEVSLHLFDYNRNIDVSFLPELARSNYLSGNIEINTDRLVIGYSELREKVVVFGSELDDRIIEIIKFRMLEKADNKNIIIHLDHFDDDHLIFYIHGLKAGQIGVSRIPRSVYAHIEDGLSELLEKENIKLFTVPPYVSVNNIYLED